MIVVKAGRTRAGSSAAGSHIAALANNDAAVDALFHQCGVVRAETLDEMLDIASGFDLQPLPRGRRVGIITNAGGPAILAADACASAGLVLADLAPETRQQIAQCVPDLGTCANPLDLTASAGPDDYRRAVEAILSSPLVDSLIVIVASLDRTTNGRNPRAIH